MIVSDKYQFIIANPPKTGTTSLHGLVDKWVHGGGDPAVLGHLRGEKITRHRLAPPEGKEHYARYMMARDPRGRLTSMYEFFRLRTTDQKWIAPLIQEVEAEQGREKAWLWTLKWLLSYREEDGYFDGGLRGVHGIQPYMWTDNQLELLQYMEGWDINNAHLPWWSRGVRVRPLLLENFWGCWGDLLRRHGVEEPELCAAVLPRRNAVPDSERLFGDGASYWMVPGALGLLEDLCGGRGGLQANIQAFALG